MFLAISANGLTLDVGFKLSDVCPRNLGVDNISLGGDLGRRGGGKSDIPVDWWFIDYFKTLLLARLRVHALIRHTVVEEHLSEFLCLFISRSLGSIDIINMVFHVSAISPILISCRQ